jgi:hypothetical protein
MNQHQQAVGGGLDVGGDLSDLVSEPIDIDTGVIRW